MQTTTSRPRRILFTGYAPVHFLCFLPVYRRLQVDARVELWLSGGFKVEQGDEVSYELAGFYDPYAVERRRVITVEQARKEHFDVLVCAHLSDSLFPGAVDSTVQIFHGVSFKNLAVRDKALRFDTLCLPGAYHANLYRRAGLVRPGGTRCLVTGMPKADPLAKDGQVDGRLDSADRALAAAMGLDPGLPTVLFAPTGDKHNALESAGEEVIRRISADGRFNLLVKPHDHPKSQIDWFARLAPLEGERMRLVRDKDVVPHLAAADLLLTDASSVAVEFTLLDRPIVFLDVPRLLEKVRKRAPNLDLDTYGRRIGLLCERPEEVVSAVADALAHPGRESALRRAMAQDVFYRPGGATERVAGVIRSSAGLDPLPADVEVVEPGRAASGAT